MPPKPKTPKTPTSGEERPATPVEPIIETGTFYYDSGATYEGEFTMMYENGKPFIPPPAEGDPAAGAKKDDKKGKKGEPDAEAEPEKPPERVRHGKGKYTDGAYSYDGEFQMDQFHGQGTFVFGSGSKYQGQFVKGVFQGRGTYTWTDGTMYEGEWANNQMHGEGMYTDKAGHRWAGEFEENRGPGLINQL
mmetsp:Transcript_22131/g.48578  ORF Transcript_22131/g.48578 Transcript_22131/m.48578 type:complete len:191 (+) Transcript_22131:289-861(+)|eukprot:CAMPEP_0118943346 /NCGR_PEP_ID=MMETSP1169-20130426/38123_1 /TAXON_ID=36882 /ORGANISM="Pyramimonas obovata, Strain CCMP722" /LENGTH=190 /DNA_ID=CAMNT_0006888583 /DNA_START=276 /DNA_END=848 /DNA_ORIENTATION=-